MAMKDILRKSLNDIFGKKIKFEDWQVLTFYSLIAMLAVLVYAIT